MKKHIASRTALWLALSVVVFAPIVLVVTSLLLALHNAQRGGAFFYGLAVFVISATRIYALPSVILISASILSYGALILFIPRADHWVTVLLLLPSLAVAFTWLLWVYSYLYSGSQSEDVATIIIPAILLPRALFVALRPGPGKFVKAGTV